MVTLTKPAVRDAWADKASAPQDIVDPGNAYVASGWLQSTIPPARQYFNWLINYCMNGVRYLCRRGIPDWDIAESYLVGDVVLDPSTLTASQCTANVTGGAIPSLSASWAPLKGYATTASQSAAIAAALVPYHTIAAFNASIANYVTTAALNTALGAYATLAYLNTQLAKYLPLTGGTLTGNLTLAGGDLKVYRAGGTTGVIFLTASGSQYLFYDGTQYQLPNGAGLTLGGNLEASGNVYSAGALLATQTFANNAAAQSQATAESYAAAVAGSAQTNAETFANSAIAAMFASVFANNAGTNPGFIKLPNDMIFQWGTTAVVGSGITQTFATPFPGGQVISIVATATGRNIQGPLSVQVTSGNTFIIYCQQISNYSWFAIGY